MLLRKDLWFVYNECVVCVQWGRMTELLLYIVYIKYKAFQKVVWDDFTVRHISYIGQIAHILHIRECELLIWVCITKNDLSRESQIYQFQFMMMRIFSVWEERVYALIWWYATQRNLLAGYDDDSGGDNFFLIF